MHLFKEQIYNSKMWLTYFSDFKTFWYAYTRILSSESLPLDLNLSTSSRNFPVSSGNSSLIFAKVTAKTFNSFLEEYFLGHFPSTKLKISPQLLCPVVLVDGFLDVLI